MSTALITAPSWLNAKQWTEDCFRWRGKLLTGVLSHWCWDWDFLPVDETTMEITCCGCPLIRKVTHRSGRPEVVSLWQDCCNLATRLRSAPKTFSHDPDSENFKRPSDEVMARAAEICRKSCRAALCDRDDRKCFLSTAWPGPGYGKFTDFVREALAARPSTFVYDDGAGNVSIVANVSVVAAPDSVRVPPACVEYEERTHEGLIAHLNAFAEKEQDNATKHLLKCAADSLLKETEELAELRQIIASAKQAIDDGEVEDARAFLDADDAAPPSAPVPRYEREIFMREISDLRAALSAAPEPDSVRVSREMLDDVCSKLEYAYRNVSSVTATHVKTVLIPKISSLLGETRR